MKLLLPFLALAVLTPVVKAQSDPAPFDPIQIRKNMASAARLSDSIKADRFNLILTADFLRLDYAIYASDQRYAGRETAELAALETDLEAIDAVFFPSVDTGYEKLVTKASADFKKLYDKDQEIQTELKD